MTFLILFTKKNEGRQTFYTLPVMRISAGILLYRRTPHGTEVFLAHPGGPYWGKKDIGVWSIPKGEVDAGEDDMLLTARREFKEETGCDINGTFIPLAPVKQRSGKIVHAWACEGDIGHANFSSNTIMIEWPPKSGRQMEIPEVDKWEWFTPAEARMKINPGQVPLIDELELLIPGTQ